MKSIDVQARLEYARAGVAVLRGLHLSNSNMRYAQFARAIGLMAPSEKWEVWHRGQVTEILNLVAAAARQGGGSDIDSLHFERILNADGKPGTGFWKSSKIVSG